MEEPETRCPLDCHHAEDLTMIKAGYMGTYVEAVFTENYQPVAGIPQ